MEQIKVNPEGYMSDIMIRMTRLEAGHRDIVEKHYQFDKELSGVNIDLKYIREGLDQTKGGIQKLLYGIAAIFITYIVGFIVSGGLTVP